MFSGWTEPQLRILLLGSGCRVAVKRVRLSSAERTALQMALDHTYMLFGHLI